MIAVAMIALLAATGAVQQEEIEKIQDQTVVEEIVLNEEELSDEQDLSEELEEIVFEDGNDSSEDLVACEDEE